MNKFDWTILTPEDGVVLAKMLANHETCAPDLVIAEGDGEPYLYRWHIIPRNADGNVYVHVQVASDPARPVHDHPWDNTTVMLGGAYFEKLTMYPADVSFQPRVYKRVKGDVVTRQAHFAHRLILPENAKYAMTLFTTGPKKQPWGFWFEGKKLPAEDVTEFIDGISYWRGPNVKEDDHGTYRI